MELGWFCGLSIVLLLVTLVGHGIWVLIAKIVGGGGSRKYPAVSELHALDDLSRTAAEITHLSRAGLIDAQTYQRVITALHVARSQTTPAAPPTPVLPASPPPAAQPTPDLPPAVPTTPQPPPRIAPPPLPQTSPPPPAPPPPPPPKVREPRRPLSDVLAAFMRDSNIRWGELIGGMLIIGGSVALVVSFWSQIAHHSFLQFAVFTGVTVALLGLGLYAEHRWKLPTTSRGILLIATLLVPLNFLAFAALSHGARPSPTETAIELAVLGLFAFLVWRAAPVLSPYWPHLLTLGVTGLSASLLAIQHTTPDPHTPKLLALAAIPLAVYAGTTGLMLARVRRWRQIRAHALDAVYLLLGVLTFAAAVATGLLVFRAASPWDAAHRLAPLLSLATSPALATGLLVWRRVQDRRLATARTTGTAIAVAATFLMLGAVALAWPDASSILPLAVADFLVLSCIAFAFAVPVAHVPAVACLLVAYLLGFHLARGHIGWSGTPEQTARALLDPTGGPGLLPLFALAAVVAGLLRSQRRVPDALVYRGFALAVALVSLALVSREGLTSSSDPYGATWVYLAYSAAAFAAAIRLRRTEAAWAGCLLLLAASAKGFLALSHVAFPWSTGLLAAATLLAVAALALARAGWVREVLGDPLKWTATLAPAVAAMLLLPDASMPASQAIGLHLLWAAAIWFAIALAESSEPVFVAAQLALAGATAVLVVARLRLRTWFAQSGAPLLEPWMLQTVGAALACLPLFAAGARLALPHRLPVSRWLRSPWSFDRALLLALSAGLAIVVVVAGFQAVQIEFALRGARPAFGHWALLSTGPGAWVLLALLLVTVTAWSADRTESLAPLLWMSLAVLACPLLAARWAPQGAAASALRWWLAGFLLAASLPLWLRHHAPARWNRVFRDSIVADARVLLVALCALPVIALSVYPASMTLDGLRVTGPDAASFFARIGNAASYTIPLAVVALTFAGNALRERSGGWALAATAVCNFAVTLGDALAVATSGGAWDAPQVVRLVQLNVLVLAGSALAWLGMRRFAYRRDPAPPPLAPALLTTQLALALVGVALLLAPPAAAFLIAPDYATTLPTVGSPLGWLATLAAFIAWGWRLRRPSAAFVACAGAASAVMLACAASNWDPTNWLAFHVLLASVVGAATGTVGVGALVTRRMEGWAQAAAAPIPTPVDAPAPSESIALQYQREDPAAGPPAVATAFVGGEPVRPAYLLWSGLLSTWAILLALRAMFTDPQRPWWSASATLSLSVLWIGIACWITAPRLLYVGGVLLNLAATFWWAEKPWLTGPNPLLELLSVNGAVLAVSGLAALVLHVQVFRSELRIPRLAIPPFHRFAAAVATAVVVALGAFALSNAVDGFPPPPAALTAWLAVAAAALLVLATLTDTESLLAPVELYAIGLAAVVMLAEQLRPAPDRVAFVYALATAGFVLCSSVVYAARGVIAPALAGFGLPVGGRGRSLAWLAWANTLLAVAVVCLATQIDLSVNERLVRMLAASAAIVQLAGFLLICREERRLDLRQTTILLCVGAVILWAWSWMTPSATWPLDRAALTQCVLLAAAAACVGIAIRRAETEAPWDRAVASVAPLLAATWTACLLGIIGFEIIGRGRLGTIGTHRPAVVEVLVALPLAAVACVMLALRTGRDPLGIPGPMRSAYVYASEAMLALAFVHLRVTMPWLFGGVLAQYWPLVVMGIAFAGVGVGELLRRRRVHVIAGPLLGTGLFLPLLPVLAFWLAPSRVDLPELLFVVGFFYAVLSAARRSFTLGVVAAVAANGGLWALLARQPELRFLVHPQLWLIPAAASVLIAAQLNRDRLPARQLRVIRYACLTVVYVSSTADIFLNGVRDHPWLPLVLAGLSVGGALTGMLFRIRAFLFLGTAFLGVSVVTMIYYASANLHWTWLWYVAVIALGTAIIVLFALFEKKRTEMLALVEGLRRWQ